MDGVNLKVVLYVLHLWFRFWCHDHFSDEKNVYFEIWSNFFHFFKAPLLYV